MDYITWHDQRPTYSSKPQHLQALREAADDANRAAAEYLATCGGSQGKLFDIGVYHRLNAAAQEAQEAYSAAWREWERIKYDQIAEF